MTKTRRLSTNLTEQLLRAVTGGESKYYQRETLASSIQKKESDTDARVIDKV